MKKLKSLLLMLSVVAMALTPLSVTANTEGNAETISTEENVEIISEEENDKNNVELVNMASTTVDSSANTTDTVTEETNKKDTITVNYHRNYGNDGTDTVTMAQEHAIGDRMEGVYIEDEYTKTPNTKFNVSESWYSYQRNGIEYRTVAWNTKPDGSGQWYRMGYTVTSDIPNNIDLYMQWISLYDLAKVYVTDIHVLKPNITLIGGDQAVSDAQEHESKEQALDVDYSQMLNYRAVLEFEQIRTQLITLWGRLDKVVSNYGFLEARFDKRLLFEDNAKIAFYSTWLEPNQDKFAEAGVISVTEKEPNRYVFEITRDMIQSTKDADGNYIVKLPVKMISKDRLNTLSFDDFMRTMEISVDDSFERGINTIITPESYNEIATSDNPYLIVGGKIDLTINGRIFASGSRDIQEFTINMPQANDEYARLFPHGNIIVNYYENKTNRELTNTKNWQTKTYMGRSSHEAYTDAKGNRTDSYTLENFGVTGYNFVYAEIIQEDGARIVTDAKGNIISIVKNGVATNVDMKSAIANLKENGTVNTAIKVGDKFDFNYKKSSIINLYFERDTTTPTTPEIPDDKDEPTTPTTPTTPSTPTTPPSNGEEIKDVPKAENKTTNKDVEKETKKTAPKTNDYSVLGVNVMMASVSALVLLRKRKEN